MEENVKSDLVSDCLSEILTLEYLPIVQVASGQDFGTGRGVASDTQTVELT